MSTLQRGRGGRPESGGIVGYPLESLYEEVAFLGYYLHWDSNAILNMPHSERKTWCEEVGKINKRITEDAQR